MNYKCINSFLSAGMISYQEGQEISTNTYGNLRLSERSNFTPLDEEKKESPSYTGTWLNTRTPDDTSASSGSLYSDTSAWTPSSLDSGSSSSSDSGSADFGGGDFGGGGADSSF